MPLDIRQLHRKGRLQPGSSFGWYWTRGDEPVGNIGVSAGISSLELSYTWTPRGGEPQYKRYDVRLEWTPCRYGGSRPWFLCLGCNRRCALLYGLSRDGYFACRRCLKLAYASEAEDALGRLWRKQRKLEAKLGEDDEKPKGMRWRTYERLCDKIAGVEQARDTAFMFRAAALLDRNGITLDELLK